MLNEILAIVFGLAVLTLFAVPLISRFYKQRVLSKQKAVSTEEVGKSSDTEEVVKTPNNIIAEPVVEGISVEKSTEVILKESFQEGKGSAEGTSSMEGKSYPVGYVSKEGKSLTEDYVSAEGEFSTEGEGSSEGEGYDEGFFGEDEEDVSTFTKIEPKRHKSIKKSIQNLPDNLKIILFGNVLNNKNDEY